MYSEATERLIRFEHGTPESFTTMLWTNILAEKFPLNDNAENWLYAPEYAYNDRNNGKRGRCDLVLFQSDTRFPEILNALGLPFLAMECKKASATKTELDDAHIQLAKTLAYLRGHWIQPLYGMVAYGTLAFFYEWDNGALKAMRPTQDGINIADQKGRALVDLLLNEMKSNTPAIKAQFH